MENTQTKPNHTQGEWKVNISIDEIYIEGGNGKPIYQMFTTKFIPESTAIAQANAQLMSASPDLYKVVLMDYDKHIMGKDEFFKKHGIDWEKIGEERIKALAKAEGK